jgi:DNA-binding MarR family transcriptional regulator
MVDLDGFDVADPWPTRHEQYARVDPQICRSVHGAYHALMRRLATSSREHGLDASEALVLAWLRRSPGCAPTVLRHAFGFHRSTLSSILNRLERDGLLNRGTRSFGVRRLELNLTEAGLLAASIADAVIRDVEAHLAEYTSKAERRGAEAVYAACEAIAPIEAALDI